MQSLKAIFTVYLVVSHLCCTYAQKKKKDTPISPNDDIFLSWEVESDTVKLVATNKLLTPIQMYFSSKKDSTELQSFLLPAKGHLELIKQDNRTANTSLRERFADSISVHYYWGHKTTIQPDLDFLYGLPFKKNKKYRVTQSFNGKSSHNTISSKYAIDFQLEVGEAVHAARSGIVVKVIDWFTKQGGPELRKAANRVVIMHNDGTLASYVHLEYQGSLVKEGQKVEKGQQIGISGLTGYTNGPHLHFVVRKEKDISIPIYF